MSLELRQTVQQHIHILEEITFAHAKDSERTHIPPVPLSAELQAHGEAQVQAEGH